MKHMMVGKRPIRRTASLLINNDRSKCRCVRAHRADVIDAAASSRIRAASLDRVHLDRQLL